MGLSRRHAVTGVALAGCSEVRSDVESRAGGILGGGEHPLAGVTTITVVNNSESDHNVKVLTDDVAVCWTEHAAEYTGVDVSFRRSEEGTPDIELVFFDSRTGSTGCGDRRLSIESDFGVRSRANGSGSISRPSAPTGWPRPPKRETTGGIAGRRLARDGKGRERNCDAAARSRTWDNLGNNQVLYQLSYGGLSHSTILRFA